MASLRDEDTHLGGEITDGTVTARCGRSFPLNCLGDSLRLWRELGLPREQARTLRRLAAVHDGNGNPQAAEVARREAQRLVDELGLHETEELPVLHT